MKPHLVALDLDGTVLRGQSQRMLLSYLFARRAISWRRYLHVALWFLLYRFGLVHDPKKVAQTAFDFLKGTRVADMESTWDDFFTQVVAKQIYPEAYRLVESHRSSGRRVLVVSNTVAFIAERAARLLGADGYLSTKLEVHDERYTGRIDGELMYGAQKATAVRKLAGELGVAIQDVWAYGDHLSDVPLLEIAGHPHATNPSPALLARATRAGWTITNL